MPIETESGAPEGFRSCIPLRDAPRTPDELAKVLLTLWPDPALPVVTQVDSVSVVTSTEGLDAELAELVSPFLDGNCRAVVVIQGLAIHPGEGA